MSAPVAPQNPHPATPPPHPRGRYLARLSLLALGVVYGDIGTSPLYALREAFHGQHGIPVTPGNVLGVLSLIFWSLLLIVTVKYHVVIIRADNKGEGGVLALMALVNGSRVTRGLTPRSEEHTSELQSHSDLVCRLLLEKKNKNKYTTLIQ